MLSVPESLLKDPLEEVGAGWWRASHHEVLLRHC